MKDSGIEWIGEIPEGWDVRRLRFLCAITTGSKDTIDRVDDGKYPFYVRSPNIEKINSYSYDGEAVLMAGDGVGAGRVFHHVNEKFDFHQRVYCFFNFLSVFPKYLYYYMENNFHKEIDQVNAKSTVDSIRLPMIKDFQIALPTMDSQKRIAVFLDEKCSKIDRIIELEKAAIEKLKAYKQAVITEAVTKGLNPNFPMKDSGIEWIGEIPENWECRLLKYWLTSVTDGAHISPETENGVFDFISTKDIDENGIDFNNCLRTCEENYDYLVRMDCKPRLGDVLFSKDGTIGRTVIVNTPHDFVVASSLIIIRPSCKILDSRFLNFLLNATYFMYQINKFVKGTGLQRLSIRNLLKTIGLFPPLLEQQQIAVYLDKKCAAINSLINNKNDRIKKLAEYKKSLIYEAVTGKLEARTRGV
jgi:type I restriction enzyme S subunit